MLLCVFRGIEVSFVFNNIIWISNSIILGGRRKSHKNVKSLWTTWSNHWHPHNCPSTISITNNSIASKLLFIQMGSTIFEISLIIFCTKFTPWHYQLLTKKRLYQGLHQRKYTHCEAPGCRPIMACEVIHLWTKSGFIMCRICWLVWIC